MLEMRSGIKYTIICTQNVREVSQDYPHSKIILLSDKDVNGWTVVAIEERR